MIELEHDQFTMPDDPLFRERFQTLMEKSLTDMKTFAERENRPLEETRRAVAEWHCTYLFAKQSAPGIMGAAYASNAKSILRDTSQMLETLHALSGVHAFILAVEPMTEDTFLGGTVLAREYWRGLRGGGETGAKGLQTYCSKKGQTIASDEGPSLVALKNSTHAVTASEIKTEVYTAFRDLLRAACGIRTAEMKWSNHGRLSSYNVRLIGWPASIPQQNPSSMTVKQNTTLLESLKDGIMRFERIDGCGSVFHEPLVRVVPKASEIQMDDISWAWKDDEPSVSVREQVQTVQQLKATESQPIIQNIVDNDMSSLQDYALTNDQGTSRTMLDGEKMVENVGGLEKHTHPSSSNNPSDLEQGAERPPKRLRASDT